MKRASAWLLENKRLGFRNDWLGYVIESLLQAACTPLVAARPQTKVLEVASQLSLMREYHIHLLT